MQEKEHVMKLILCSCVLLVFVKRIYITKPEQFCTMYMKCKFLSMGYFSALKKAHNSQLPRSISPDYKYLHARQIPHQLSFHSQTIPDCIRYIIGVFCNNFKSQTNILCFILTHWLSSKLRYSPCSGIYTCVCVCVSVCVFFA